MKHLSINQLVAKSEATHRQILLNQFGGRLPIPEDQLDPFNVLDVPFIIQFVDFEKLHGGSYSLDRVLQIDLRYKDSAAILAMTAGHEAIHINSIITPSMVGEVSEEAIRELSSCPKENFPPLLCVQEKLDAEFGYMLSPILYPKQNMADPKKRKQTLRLLENHNKGKTNRIYCFSAEELQCRVNDLVTMGFNKLGHIPQNKNEFYALLWGAGIKTPQFIKDQLKTNEDMQQSFCRFLKIDHVDQIEKSFNSFDDLIRSAKLINKGINIYKLDDSQLERLWKTPLPLAAARAYRSYGDKFPYRRFEVPSDSKSSIQHKITLDLLGAIGNAEQLVQTMQKSFGTLEQARLAPHMNDDARAYRLFLLASHRSETDSNPGSFSFAKTTGKYFLPHKMSGYQRLP
jgi:hypothetical protein